MSFASIPFVVFFLMVMAVICISTVPIFESLAHGKMPRIRQSILLIASYVFYGWWDARFCVLMLVLTASAFFSVKKMEREQDIRRRRAWLILGVVGPLTVLVFFKYFHFFLDTACAVFGMERPGTLSIILPVGISFYTFQSLSYVIDVYRGKYIQEKSFLKVALYIAFFPQLVAGPIVKAGDFLPQLEEDRKPTPEGIGQGLQIFLFGMVKKIVLADHLSVFVDDVFAAPQMFSSMTVWWAVISYSFQIYFDFSGYSDMAIGCAKILGYDLPRNFNLPYLAKNVSEFWKRWHISLSAWLQEYLYFSMGGNRRGNLYVNLMLTMILGGLWHGADWTFVVWGALHGAALCIHKFYLRHRRRDCHTKILTVVSVFFTYVFVSLCWVLFRADSFSTAADLYQRMFSIRIGLIQPYIWTFITLAIFSGAVICAAVRSRRLGLNSVEGFYYCGDLSRFWPMVLFFTVAALTLGFAYSGANPFIYFRF